MPIGDRFRKLAVALVAGLLAVGSGIALTHVGRAPDRSAAEVDEATPTIGEGRNLTREILRSRREHGDAMAEVHPDPSLGERQPIIPQDTVPKETASKDPATKEAKEHAAAAKAKPTAVAVAMPRSRPEAAEDAAASDPAAGQASGAPPEQHRSIGAMVFSTVSNLTGKAANLTGDTANFVIDLPGKLISAGGKLFERPQPPPDPAPPQKRDAL